MKPLATILILVACVISLFIIDRSFLMPRRLNSVWEYDRGCYMGDPVVVNQHFHIEGDRIVFADARDGAHKNNHFIFVGAYLGSLMYYDPVDGVISRYSEKGYEMFKDSTLVLLVGLVLVFSFPLWRKAIPFQTHWWV